MPVLKRPQRSSSSPCKVPSVANYALKPKLLRLRPLRYPLSLLLCVSILLLVLFHSSQQQSVFTERTPIGRTTAGSPLHPLPRPYGIAASVMRSVLDRVHQLVYSGSKLDFDLIASTADPEHLHGSLIGHYPDSRIPAWTPTPFNFSLETREMKVTAHAHTCYNQRRSNALPLDRPIPDVRPANCQSEWYYQENAALRQSHSPSLMRRAISTLGLGTVPADISLPTTSVVFVFYNEPLSTLLRAIHSVLDRTPPHLLHEIILVDDGSDSDAPWLAEGAEFENHLQLLPKVKLARCIGRNGLMRARNIGASIATGQTVTYLDSHIEVNVGWIEPLLGRIAEGWRNGVEHVVVPVIDSIDADTFQYKAGGIDILGHTWGLGQTAVPQAADMEDPSPKRSPIMAGGLLSLSRAFFDKLGFYDPEMELWGGEEMEISFRIWLCGGTLECMPCSRVGHVFRSSKYWQGQAYKVPGDVIARNKLRASYWMEEYGDLVKLSAAPIREEKGLGSMQHYEDIRNRLQCKPYRWYLENVYPTMLSSANRLMGNGSVSTKGFPASGYVKNPASGACLDSLHHKPEGSIYGIYPCHYLRGSQSTMLTHSHLVLQGEFLLEGCLTRADNSRLVKRVCEDNLRPKQTWKMEKIERNGQHLVRMVGEGNCLTVVDEEEEEKKSPFTLRMMPCDEGVAESQEWEWEEMELR